MYGCVREIQQNYVSEYINLASIKTEKAEWLSIFMLSEAQTAHKKNKQKDMLN